MNKMKRRARLGIFKAADGWRWHIRARNGKIVAEGGEAYINRAGAERAVSKVGQHVAEALSSGQPDQG